MTLLLFLDTFSTLFLFFFFNDTATTEIYTLSLHDALPISGGAPSVRPVSGLPLRQVVPRAGPEHRRQRGRRRGSGEVYQLRSLHPGVPRHRALPAPG